MVFFYELEQVGIKISSDIVIVDNINQIHVLKTFLQKVLALFLGVNYSPCVNPRLKSLVLPNLKSLVINYRRLDNFFTFENTPGDCVDVCFTHVFELRVALSINSLISNIVLGFKIVNQFLDQIFVHEKFDVGFLVNVSIFWTPAKLSISRLGTIDLWLRINGEELVLVQLQ